MTLALIVLLPSSGAVLPALMIHSARAACAVSAAWGHAAGLRPAAHARPGRD
ncbi:MAG: hypothetical protein U5K33_07845 [Halofilum sp. (in: g-proteobacteria)]|nr:hypothetical protein [Halofilum sp. (in: g-proteobacteria)]